MSSANICAAFLLAALTAAAEPPFAREIEEIDRIAASEPPLLGIDTQIRAARAVAAPRRDESARLLRSASFRIAALTHQPTRVSLLADWLDVQTPLDREEAAAFFGAFLDSFPGQRPAAEDREALSDLAKKTKKDFPELAARAQQIAEAGAKGLPKPPRKDQPEGTLFMSRGPKLDGLSHDDILALARKQKDPSIALDLIMHVMDDEPDARRRVSLLSEALDLSARTDNLIDRLLAQSMLTRRLYDAGDLPRAAVGAQMLAENFERLYHCESAACDRFEGEDNPGEIIHSFAEYLLEHNIPPERIGLSHPSLRVRILLLQIEAATARKDP